MQLVIPTNYLFFPISQISKALNATNTAILGVLNKEMDSIGSKCKKTYYASGKLMHCKQQGDS